MSLSPHEYTPAAPTCRAGAPSLAFERFSRLVVDVLGWPPPGPAAKCAAAVNDGGTVRSRTIYLHRRGGRCAAMSASHATLRLCGVWRFVPAGTLCVFPCARSGAVQVTLPGSPCHLLLCPEHALGAVLLEGGGATNVWFRRPGGAAADVEVYLRAGGEWLCAGCGDIFATVDGYRAHVGARGDGALALEPLLAVEYGRPMAPFATHDHGSVPATHAFNCELHARLRELRHAAAKQGSQLYR
jgi:hypothetical protein